MDDVNKAFLSALQRLVTSVQQLNQLLVDDNQYFIANNLNKINESNDKKNAILVELGTCAGDLNKLIPTTSDGRKFSIHEHIDQLDSHTAAHSRKLLDTLYLSLTNGYNHLVTNNHVIVENLGFFNDVWDSLLKIANQSEGVYTKPELK